MLSLRDYTLKQICEVQKLESDIDYLRLWNIQDPEKWLNETYDESLGISEEEFYKQKYDNVYYDTPKYWFWQKMLYETLSHSLETSDSIFLKLLCNIKGVEKVEVYNDYKLDIIISKEFDINDELFQSFLNFTNYIVVNQEENVINLEAKIPKEISYSNKYAYHVTTPYFLNKIKRNGLIPRNNTGTINHDQRIYLWIGNDLKYNMKQFARLSIILYKINNIKDNEKHNLYDIDVNDSVILQIDLKQFEKDHLEKLRLFGDPAYNLNSAVFTLEPISTKYIKEISLKEIE